MSPIDILLVFLIGLFMGAGITLWIVSRIISVIIEELEDEPNAN